jgi:formylglycine-generating enzyme required for sulfatase activity
MKRMYFLSLMVIFSLVARGQVVTNVTSRLENGKAAVSFTLQTPCHCTLSYSPDGGRTFVACKAVSGDTANNTTGSRTFYWDYFADGVFSGSLLFKVEAEMFEMVFVSGGTFQMGSNDGESDEKPVHTVTLSDYLIGKTEVTQALWKSVMVNNPSHFKGDDLPVERVSWSNCQEFISKLNKMTGKTYRLPTESEWEYAARGGTISKGYSYSGSNNLNEVAWYGDNSGSTTHPVGSKQPNELGLYDMSGNVWEWCSDWFGRYSSGAQTNPTGASSGSSRVYRGGGWFIDAQRCRVTYRDNNFAPVYRSSYLGFRLVLVPE